MFQAILPHFKKYVHSSLKTYVVNLATNRTNGPPFLEELQKTNCLVTVLETSGEMNRFQGLEKQRTGAFNQMTSAEVVINLDLNSYILEQLTNPSFYDLVGVSLLFTFRYLNH